MLSFAAVLYCLFVFRFALAERKTKYRYEQQYHAAAAEAAFEYATA
jgi:hypothetical protein